MQSHSKPDVWWKQNNEHTENRETLYFINHDSLTWMFTNTWGLPQEFAFCLHEKCLMERYADWRLRAVRWFPAPSNKATG